MSEDATFQVEEWFKGFDIFEGVAREQMVRETQMIARALALQVLGVIPLHSDMTWVNESVQEVSMESLHKGH